MMPREQREHPPADRQELEGRLSEFLLRMCHDLRSPLRAIRTHSELIARGCLAPQDCELEKHVGFVIDGAREMETLLDSLAGYSIALQAEREPLQPTRMDVTLRSVLAKLDHEIHRNQAEVTYNALPLVSGNPDRLIQVFENLLLNALRHRSDRPPRIRVDARQEGESWVISVQDNGPGIEPAYLDSIFLPFVRLHGTGGGGSGLGLAICRAIIERHGGRIWAESKIGSGSTFFFALPWA
jgi:signal transduction histidine kinase